MEFGELFIILIQNDITVYFVMNIFKVHYHSEYHFYLVTKPNTRLQSLSRFLPINILHCQLATSHSTKTVCCQNRQRASHFLVPHQYLQHHCNHFHS